MTMHAAVARQREASRRILAIDPGSAESAWLLLVDGVPDNFAKVPNNALLELLRIGPAASVVVIEWTAPRGMPASAELFETMWWAGRFTEATSLPVERLQRSAIKKHLCGVNNANDANVRAALIDRFGGIGGKEAAIGRKSAPGPLHGVSADIWAALAVAVSWADGIR